MAESPIQPPVPKPRRAHLHVAMATEQRTTAAEQTEHTQKSQASLKPEEQLSSESPSSAPPRPHHPPVSTLDSNNHDDNAESENETEDDKEPISSQEQHSDNEGEEPQQEVVVVLRQRRMPPPTGTHSDDDDDYENIDAHLDDEKKTELRRSDYINWVYMDEEETDQQDGAQESSVRNSLSREPPSIKLKNHPVLKKSQSSSSVEQPSDYEILKRLRPKNRAPPPPPGPRKQPGEDGHDLSGESHKKGHKRSTSDLNFPRNPSPQLSRQSSGGAVASNKSSPHQIRAPSPANRAPSAPGSPRNKHPGAPKQHEGLKRNVLSPDAIKRNAKSQEVTGSSPKQPRRAFQRDVERNGGGYAPIKLKDVDQRSRGYGHAPHRTEAESRPKGYHKVAIKTDESRARVIIVAEAEGKPTNKGYSKVAIRSSDARTAEVESKPTAKGYSRVAIKTDDGKIYERFSRQIKSHQQSGGEKERVYDKPPKPRSQDKPSQDKPASQSTSHEERQTKQETTPTVKPKRHAPPPPMHGSKKSPNSSPEGLVPGEGDSPRELERPSSSQEDPRPPKPQRRKKTNTDEEGAGKDSFRGSSDHLETTSSTSSILANLDIFTITLHRDEGSTLGLVIVMGKARNSDGEVVEGVFVQKVLPDSVADKDGRIQSGDMLVEAGGSNMVGGTLEQAMRVLKEPTDSITLKIGRPDILSSVFATEGDEEEPIYVNRLTQSDQELLAKLEAAELKIAELETEREKAEGDLEVYKEEAAREKQSLQQLLDEKQNEFEQYQTEASQSVTDLTETLASVSVEKTKAERQMETLKQTSDEALDLQHQLRQAQAESRTLEEKLQDSEKQLHQLEQKLCETEEKLSTTEELLISQLRALEQEKKKTSELQDKLKLAKKEEKAKMAEMLAKIQKQAEQISNLRQELETAKTSHPVAVVSTSVDKEPPAMADITASSDDARDVEDHLNATYTVSKPEDDDDGGGVNNLTYTVGDPEEDDGGGAANNLTYAVGDPEDGDGGGAANNLTDVIESSGKDSLVVEEEGGVDTQEVAVHLTTTCKSSAFPYISYVPLNDHEEEKESTATADSSPQHTAVVDTSAESEDTTLESVEDEQQTVETFNEFDAVKPMKRLDNSHLLHKSKVAAFQRKRKPSRDHLRTVASSPDLLNPQPHTPETTTAKPSNQDPRPDVTSHGTTQSQDPHEPAVQHPLVPPKPKPRAAPRRKAALSTPALVDGEMKKPQVVPRHRPEDQHTRSPSPETETAKSETNAEVSEPRKVLPATPTKKLVHSHPAVVSEERPESSTSEPSSPERQKKTKELPKTPLHESPKIKKKEPLFPSPWHLAKVSVPSSPVASPKHSSSNLPPPETNGIEDKQTGESQTVPNISKEEAHHPVKPVAVHQRQHSAEDIVDSGDLHSRDPSELTIKEKARRVFETMGDDKLKLPPPILRKPTKSAEAEQHVSSSEMSRGEIESSPVRERAKSLDNELDASPRRRMKLPPGAFNIGLPFPPMLVGKPERERSVTIATDEPVSRNQSQHDCVVATEADTSQGRPENIDAPLTKPETKSAPPKRPPPPFQKKPSNEKPSSAQSSPKHQRLYNVNGEGSGGATTSDSDASPQLHRSNTRESCDLAETETSSNPLLRAGVHGHSPDPDGVDFDSVLTWTPDTVASWLVVAGLGQYQQLFTDKGIQGYMLFDLDGSRLKGMGLSSHEDRAVFKREVKSLRPYADRQKKVLDRERKDVKKMAKRKKKFV